MKKSMKLACLNMNANKRQNKIFCFVISIGIILYLLSFTMVNGFQQISNNYKIEDYSLREIRVWDETKRDKDVLQKISKLKNVCSASQYYNIELNNGYTISIDGIDLNCLPYIRGMNRKFSFAPMKMILENNQKYVDPIICGRDFEPFDKKTVILDEDTCYILGYDNPSELIGKNVSIKLSDVIVSDIEVVGVSSYEYGNYYTDLKGCDDISRKSYLMSELSDPMFFSDDIIKEIVSSSDVCDWYYEDLRLFADNTDNVSELCMEIENYFGCHTDNMISVIEKKAENIKNICVFLYIISAIILIIALICIVNSLIIKINRKKKYTEMILKIGYQTRDIISIYMIEILFTTLKAICSSIGITFFLSIIIDAFMVRGYSDVTDKSKYLFVLKYDISGYTAFVVFLSVAIATYLVVKLQLETLRKKILG